MLSSSPLITVIVTTYNRPEYLKLTLESVVKQTYKNIEIIVVDDGSIGEKNQIVCKQFKNINYIKNINSKTPAVGRNIGVKESKGVYIAFLDDDDIWIPNKIEIQQQILENNPDFGLVHSPCQIIDSDGKLNSEIIGESFEWRNKHGDISLTMLGNFGLMMPTPLIRKSVIEKVGLFNEKMKPAGEDTEFWCRCSFETKFFYYPKSLAYYRIHSRNISQNKKNYANLPLILSKIALKQKLVNRIDSKQYKLLLKNCIRAQLKFKKKYFFKTLMNLFQIDCFWIFYLKY
jgi:glycosyltransferase involved in cell wall biosynthesis